MFNFKNRGLEQLKITKFYCCLLLLKTLEMLLVVMT